MSISCGGPSWKETRRPDWVDWGLGGVGLNRSGFARGRLERLGGALTISFCCSTAKSVKCQFTFVIFHRKAGEIVSKHLWICIISLPIPAPSTKFITSPVAVWLLLGIVLSWWLLIVILILTINLFLQIINPFVDRLLRFEKPFLDIIAYDR